jgi:hypothetical protein
MSDDEIMRAAKIIWSTKTKRECVTESKEKRAVLRSANFRKEKYEKAKIIPQSPEIVHGGLIVQQKSHNCTCEESTNDLQQCCCG